MLSADDSSKQGVEIGVVLGKLNFFWSSKSFVEFEVGPHDFEPHTPLIVKRALIGLKGALAQHYI